jgi:hypothetical protein
MALENIVDIDVIRNKKASVPLSVFIKKSVYDELMLWCDFYKKREDEIIEALIETFSASQQKIKK